MFSYVTNTNTNIIFQRISCRGHRRQLVATLCAYLPIQADRAGPKELEPIQKLQAFGHGDKQPPLLLPVRQLHLPAGPVTPVPAEARIVNNILTSVPKSLTDSVLTFNIPDMMTSL